MRFVATFAFAFLPACQACGETASVPEAAPTIEATPPAPSNSVAIQLTAPGNRRITDFVRSFDAGKVEADAGATSP